MGGCDIELGDVGSGAGKRGDGVVGVWGGDVGGGGGWGWGCWGFLRGDVGFGYLYHHYTSKAFFSLQSHSFYRVMPEIGARLVLVFRL